MNTAIVVPARLASSRFPRKLLFPLGGKPLILWTAERVSREAPGYPLYFAVGDAELAAVLGDAGYCTVMTDPALPSGTDRLAAANEQIGAERLINVQADEPLVHGAQIRQLAALLDDGADLATLAIPFRDVAEFHDSNRVKVVRNQRGDALYFSRAPIPYDRDAGGALPAGDCHLHLGLYAYTARFLRAFTHWPPGRLEQLEKLEQLRALENGCRIAVGITNERTIGIDVPADAAVFMQHLAAAQAGGL
jgi:3-deoxy-manno-octulosonate cytidylyltransferase (CMP-KDO synthetase)